MIYLARHGQTTFNAEGRFQGCADSPLTPLGVTQARNMATLLATLIEGVPAVTLWSSPLGRARQTAEIVHEGLGLQTPVRYDPRLREVGLGRWEGMTNPEIEQQHPGLRDGCGYFDWFFLSPGGESAAAVETRMRSWLDEVESLPGTHIAISHGLAGRLLRGVYADLSRTAALELDIPQDAIFRLDGGQYERIPPLA